MKDLWPVLGCLGILVAVGIAIAVYLYYVDQRDEQEQRKKDLS